jgi:subtilisin family serine protease
VDENHPSLSIESYEHGGVTSEDIVGHGTHVCGIVAGSRATAHGFGGGVCNAKLRVWKIFGDQPDEESGQFYVDEVLYQRALVGATRPTRDDAHDECRVMNLSIGGAATTMAERKLFKRLIDAGVVVVAAIGNEYLDGNPVEYPAAHDGVIAVGAVGADHRRAPFSNTGAHIALVAPGEDIVSTLPRNENNWRTEKEYAGWTGTSMAAPHVAAAAAHLLETSPRLSPSEVRRKLETLARKLPVMDGSAWSRSVGAGLLQLPDEQGSVPAG